MKHTDEAMVALLKKHKITLENGKLHSAGRQLEPSEAFRLAEKCGLNYADELIQCLERAEG